MIGRWFVLFLMVCLFIHPGALRGLSYLRTAHPVGKHNTMNAYEYLKTRLTDGGKREAQLSVRIVVVEAFARAASYVQDKSTREEAAEILAGLLMDEEQRTAETAAWALSEFLPLEAEYYRR